MIVVFSAPKARSHSLSAEWSKMNNEGTAKHGRRCRDNEIRIVNGGTEMSVNV